MPVDVQTYERLKNFCEDYKIENIPDREYMFFEIAGISGYHEPKSIEAEITYIANELFLSTVESVSGDKTLLMIGATSPALEKLSEDVRKEFDELAQQREVEFISEEPLVGIVLSSDYNGTGDDIQHLQVKLKDYVEDTLLFSDIKTQYTTEGDLIDFILDGVDPIEN